MVTGCRPSSRASAKAASACETAAGRAAALALLERAGRLKGAERWPIAYRTGIAQQQLGQRDAARASLQRFVDAGKGQKASLDDARKRLAELAAP